MTKLARIKKFAVDHQVELTIVASVALGALAVYSHYHGKTLLELPADAIKRMKENNIKVVYEVSGEGLFVLTHIPEQ